MKAKHKQTRRTEPRKPRSSIASKIKTAKAQNGGGGPSEEWTIAKTGNAYLRDGDYVAIVHFNEARNEWGLTIKSNQRFADEEDAREQAESLLALLQDD